MLNGLNKMALMGAGIELSAGKTSAWAAAKESNNGRGFWRNGFQGWQHLSEVVPGAAGQWMGAADVEGEEEWAPSEVVQVSLELRERAEWEVEEGQLG